MKSFIKRNRVSLFDVLFVGIVTGLVAAVAIPALVASRRAAENLSAIAALRSVQAAQHAYRSTTGGNKVFATFEQLSGAGLLDGSFAAARVVKNDYLYTHSLTADAAGYCAKASPVLSSGETYFFGISQKGILYRAETEFEIDCAAGILTIGGSASMVLK